MLRFSRFFRRNKSKRLPNIWKNVKVKPSKKTVLTVTKNDISSTANSSQSEIQICLEFAHTSDPKLFVTDDKVVLHFIVLWCEFLFIYRVLQVKFLQPIKNVSEQTSLDKEINDDSLINQAFWRNGPSKLWYDILGVSENGEEFDYGFKLKENIVSILYIFISIK